MRRVGQPRRVVIFSKSATLLGALSSHTVRAVILCVAREEASRYLVGWLGRPFGDPADANQTFGPHDPVVAIRLSKTDSNPGWPPDFGRALFALRSAA